MTVVGKILVFFNLVFAFVVGAFAVMAYTARTNWYDGFTKLENSYKVVKASHEVSRAEAERLTKQRESLNASLRELGKGVVDDKTDPSKAAESVVAQMRAQAAENDKLRRDLNKTNKDLEDANRKIVSYEATTKGVQSTAQRYQGDVEKLRTVLRAETERNTELVKGINEMRDRAVSAEIQAKSYRDINTRLEEQLQGLARDLARLKATGGRTPASVAQGLNPPPDQVEGLIRRVDGNLVTLTIGSDAGLQRDHTMEVFGLTGAGSGYRGKIRLVEVTPHQAVGQVVGRLRSPIKVGDTAATSIMGGKR